MSTTATACATPGCKNDVTNQLACPKCLQLGLPPTYFCSQQCFKENYAQHKAIHKVCKTVMAASTPQRSMPDWAYGFPFTGPLRPVLVKGSASGLRPVPAHIRRPDYANDPRGIPYGEQRDNGRIVTYKSSAQIAGMREAGRLGREVLDEASRALRVGVTTDEIDRIVHEACMERNCYPSPLNYHNFPKSVCTSVNEVICHGIPDGRELQDGDICNVDVTVYTANGYHGDLNETFVVGGTTKPNGDGEESSNHHLVRTAYECLRAAVSMVGPGTLYRDLGKVISTRAAEAGCSVVRTYCGHGIGTLFHTAPTIPHYSRNKARGVMAPGHVFTIEPMINAGPTYRDNTWGDNWTAVTADGSRSAQFEHTLLVTTTGCEILTARLDHNNGDETMETDSNKITTSMMPYDPVTFQR